MDLNKHLSFFNPTELRKTEINIIGCGAIGSNVALQLAKLGIEKLILWDFDIVTPHNITNQIYDVNDVNKPKLVALERHLKDQNPDILVVKKGKYTSQPLKGIIILAVDSIELRHKIAETNQYNMSISLVIDGRIGLETGQVYTINWLNYKDIENYLELTNFKDSEVEVPVSPCGTTLSVSPSVLMVTAVIVANIINFTKEKECCTITNIHAFGHIITRLK